MMTTMEQMLNPQIRLRQMQDGIIYRQAGPSGQRRMEQAVSMGLPQMADPKSWIPIGSRGIDPSGRNRPRAYALPSGGFGSGWGSIGMDREPRSTGKLQAGAPLGSAGSSGYDLARRMSGDGGPQPAETAPTPAMPSGGSPQSFTGFGGMMREQEEEMNRGLGSLTGFGGIPRFPFANY